MDWLTWRPWDFNRMAAALQLVTQFFAGHAKYLWPGDRVLAMASAGTLWHRFRRHGLATSASVVCASGWSCSGYHLRCLRWSFAV